MKFQLKNFLFQADFKDKIIVLTIENIELYRNVINSLVNETNIRDSNLQIVNKNELTIPSKHIFTIHDYFSFDINKNCLSKVYKKISEIAVRDYTNETIEIKSRIEEYVYGLIDQYDYYLDIDGELDVQNILKSIGLKIKVDENNFLEKLINQINIIRELFGINIFFFINLKEYLSEKELIDFYSYIIYNEINIVLVESKCNEKVLEVEKHYLIDNDLCEIY